MLKEKGWGICHEEIDSVDHVSLGSYQRQRPCLGAWQDCQRGRGL
jgi:hypothetical protein